MKKYIDSEKRYIEIVENNRDNGENIWRVGKKYSEKIVEKNEILGINNIDIVEKNIHVVKNNSEK